MAHHHFPSLLRSGSDLFRICYGTNPDGRWPGKLLNLEEYITIGHIESMNKVILLTGTIVGVAYLTELFIAWYSVYHYEQFAFYNRATWDLLVVLCRYDDL